MYSVSKSFTSIAVGPRRRRGALRRRTTVSSTSLAELGPAASFRPARAAACAAPPDDDDRPRRRAAHWTEVATGLATILAAEPCPRARAPTGSTTPPATYLLSEIVQAAPANDWSTTSRRGCSSRSASSDPRGARARPGWMPAASGCRSARRSSPPSVSCCCSAAAGRAGSSCRRRGSIRPRARQVAERRRPSSPTGSRATASSSGGAGTARIAATARSVSTSSSCPSTMRSWPSPAGCPTCRLPLDAVWGELLPAFDSVEAAVAVSRTDADSRHPAANAAAREVRSSTTTGPSRELGICDGVIAHRRPGTAVPARRLDRCRRCARRRRGRDAPGSASGWPSSGGWQGDVFVAEVRTLERCSSPSGSSCSRAVAFGSRRTSASAGPEVWEGDPPAWTQPECRQTTRAWCRRSASSGLPEPVRQRRLGRARGALDDRPSRPVRGAGRAAASV